MKHECDIVRDLMPMCIDGTASEKTRNMVEEHVEECPPCETVYAEMRRDAQLVMPVQESAPEFVTTVRRMKNRRQRRTWLTLLLGVVIAMTAACAGFGAYYWYFLDEVLLDTAQLTLVTSTDGIALIHASAAPRNTRLVLKLSEMVYPEDAQGQYEVYAYLYTTRHAMRGEADDTYFVVGDMDSGRVSMEHGYRKASVYRMLCGRADGSGQVFYLSTEDDVKPVSLKGAHLKSPEWTHEAGARYDVTDYGYMPTATPVPATTVVPHEDWYTMITATPMSTADRPAFAPYATVSATPVTTVTPTPTVWSTDPTPTLPVGE